MKFIFTFLFFLISATLFSQEYKYILTMPESEVLDVNKELSKKLYDMFDQSAEFEVLTNEFIIISTIDISEETFQKKMEELGYEGIIFNKYETINTINE